MQMSATGLLFIVDIHVYICLVKHFLYSQALQENQSVRFFCTLSCALLMHYGTFVLSDVPLNVVQHMPAPNQ